MYSDALPAIEVATCLLNLLILRIHTRRSVDPAHSADLVLTLLVQGLAAR
ncbi:MAG: hypothetical protein ACR2HR_14670 [Euzebya sp.]